MSLSKVGEGCNEAYEASPTRASLYFKAIVKGFHECTFDVSIGDQFEIHRKIGEKGRAFEVATQQTRKETEALFGCHPSYKFSDLLVFVAQSSEKLNYNDMQEVLVKLRFENCSTTDRKKECNRCLSAKSLGLDSTSVLNAADFAAKSPAIVYSLVPEQTSGQSNVSSCGIPSLPDKLFETLVHNFTGGQSKGITQHALERILEKVNLTLGAHLHKKKSWTSRQGNFKTTINTHCGLYEYHRIPYGINSPAVGIFQCAMENVMKGLPGVTVYMDDLLVTGRNDAEHLAHLKGALTRLQENGLKLQESKCKFLLPEVEYLGFKVSSAGIQPTESRVRAIREAPRPSNVNELRSFIGLVNYYARFLPNLASSMAPFYYLLKKDVKWQWNKLHESTFKKIKQLMSEDVLLHVAHYDANAELVLACDASSTGIGAVLQQRAPNGDLKPVVFASRSLTMTERNYAQIEREKL
ncbi:hypothetical protein QZH41_007620 [Actinostola sp. cb2023]|nr:hypothetical protein QZH41_007620 [Actinostola sp. cb2023]